MVYIVTAVKWGEYDEVIDSWGQTFCSHDELIAVIDNLMSDPRWNKEGDSILIDIERGT